MFCQVDFVYNISRTNILISRTYILVVKMKRINNKAVGRRIKERRMELGYTQEQLSELCGISTSYLGHIERGARTISVNMLYTLSEILNMSTDEILFDSFTTDDSLLVHVSAVLEKCDDEKKKQFFYNSVKTLASQIDEL